MSKLPLAVVLKDSPDGHGNMVMKRAECPYCHCGAVHWEQKEAISGAFSRPVKGSNIVECRNFKCQKQSVIDDRSFS